MKALIIDDNIFKTMDIRKALMRFGFDKINLTDNQQDGLEKIKESILNNEQYDLIVSDMHYPLIPNGEADTEAGFKLIDILNEQNFNIPIIICSSLNWNIPNILGTVWYNKTRDLEWDFKEIIDRL